MVVDPTTGNSRRAIEGSDGSAREEGSADVANETTDTVHGEDVESIVDAEEELNLGGIVGKGSSHSSKDDGGPSRDVS